MDFSQSSLFNVITLHLTYNSTNECYALKDVHKHILTSYLEDYIFG